jgi:hypothetical protein
VLDILLRTGAEVVQVVGVVGQENRVIGKVALSHIQNLLSPVFQKTADV